MGGFLLIFSVCLKPPVSSPPQNLCNPRRISHTPMSLFSSLIRKKKNSNPPFPPVMQRFPISEISTPPPPPLSPKNRRKKASLSGPTLDNPLNLPFHTSYVLNPPLPASGRGRKIPGGGTVHQISSILFFVLIPPPSRPPPPVGGVLTHAMVNLQRGAKLKKFLWFFRLNEINLYFLRGVKKLEPMLMLPPPSNALRSLFCKSFPRALDVFFSVLGLLRRL